MLWMKEIELANSVDDLETSQDRHSAEEFNPELELQENSVP